MTDTLDTQPNEASATTADTFCSYLARQFIAKRGFTRSEIPDAALPLSQHCDILLSFSDGYTITVLGLVDREAHPGKAFDMPPDQVTAICKELLKQTGRVGFNKMPAILQIMEVGPQDDSQQARLSQYKSSGIFTKAHVGGWIVDPGTAFAWTNAAFAIRRSYIGFIRKIMSAPREALSDLEPPKVAATLHAGFPYLTAAIIGVLCAIFLAELVFAVGPLTGLLQPSIATLIAFGGLYRPLAVDSGEWWRLFSAPLLHADLMHLLLNCVALYLGGRLLEGLVGRAWLAAIFVIGALCGALLSLALNGDSLVSVGASGAVMGLFATLIVLAFHFPTGADRTALLLTGIYVLIPSMIPLTSGGGKVDYAAHFGGALGGIAIGLFLLAIWRKDEAHPRFVPAAMAVGLAGLVAFAFAFTHLPYGLKRGAFGASLIPAAEFPKDDDDTNKRVDELIARYPRDPRGHYFRALALWDKNDLKGAESALRTGLAEEHLWRDVMIPEITVRMRGALAILLAADNKMDEARTMAKPACALSTSGSTRELMDKHKLCEP